MRWLLGGDQMKLMITNKPGGASSITVTFDSTIHTIAVDNAATALTQLSMSTPAAGNNNGGTVTVVVVVPAGDLQTACGRTEFTIQKEFRYDAVPEPLIQTIQPSSGGRMGDTGCLFVCTPLHSNGMLVSPYVPNDRMH